MTRLLLTAALAAMAIASPAVAAPAAVTAPTRFSVTIVGAGPDVILIPGLSSPRAVWAATAERLKATHRVHLVQVKGFGEPAGPNASGPVLAPFVADLAAYISANQIVRPAVVGHSMGGLAALMLAADHPGLPGKILVVDALPFIGPLFGAPSVTAIRPQADQMRAMLIANAAKVTPDFAAPDCPATLPAPAAPRGTMTNSGVGTCLVRYGAMASDLRVVAQAMHDDMVTDLGPKLGAIKVSVTMLYPQDDRLLSAEAAAKIYGDAYAGLPAAKLVRIPGSYHFIMQDQPALFATALDAFLK
ncbi:MAG: alpha/beta hydrolase [Sphingomonas bacterium]|nr:alpha/beta hydrolase [Sphingomonas bacterium]